MAARFSAKRTGTTRSKYLEEAVALEPNRITHRLDLAGVYADRDMKAKAIEQYEWIAKAPVTDFNDAKYKELAAQRLKDLQEVTQRTEARGQTPRGSAAAL